MWQPGRKNILFNEILYVLIDSCYAAEAERLLECLKHVWRDERRERRTDVDILDAEAQKGQQNDDGLLLVPCDVEHYRQVVDTVDTEDLFQLQSHDYP